jgi:hypothetical protein
MRNRADFAANHFRLARLRFPLMMGRALGNTPKGRTDLAWADPAVAALVAV